MGVMDKFLNYMKLNDEEDDYYDDDYLDDEEEAVEPAPKKAAAPKAVKDAEPAYEDRTSKRTVQPKVTPIRQNVTRKMPANGMEVCVIKPSTVEDAREITETLLANRTVVLNLEGLDVDIAQRIIDFTSGSCFAISGNLQKISHYIFIITPASVDISGDFQDIFGGSFEMPLNNGM
ncbi:MAG: cell division protein SepF [Muribaculum sp.]|nr:cell division protein SepF [Muribaculum sp.]